MTLAIEVAKGAAPRLDCRAIRQKEFDSKCGQLRSSPRLIGNCFKFVAEIQRLGRVAPALGVSLMLAPR